jgi:hypothetical protein
MPRKPRSCNLGGRPGIQGQALAGAVSAYYWELDHGNTKKQAFIIALESIAKRLNLTDAEKLVGKPLLGNGDRLFPSVRMCERTLRTWIKRSDIQRDSAGKLLSVSFVRKGRQKPEPIKE